MNEKKDTWTVTVEFTVFAGDMDKHEVMANTQKDFEDMVDGSDYMGVNVRDAERDI